MSNQHNASQVQQRGGGAVAVLLWVVLAVSAAANSVGFLIGMDYALRMVAGGVCLLSITLLVIYYVRRKKA